MKQLTIITKCSTLDIAAVLDPPLTILIDFAHPILINLDYTLFL